MSLTALTSHSSYRATPLCSFTEPDIRCASEINALLKVCNADKLVVHGRAIADHSVHVPQYQLRFSNGPLKF